MGVKDLLQEIEEDSIDILETDFKYVRTKNVPNSDDSDLTFERDVEKKGKVIETCVLFADIRDSVSLNKKHHTQTMGRIFTSFTKCILKAAHYHNGFVRDITGDRVFVVFHTENCYTSAVDCAISINHACQYIINKRFSNVEFRCGIGIAFGELKAIKVGLPKRGNEKSDNKNLVWIGYPANVASRLTDVANKKLSKEIYVVKRNPINPKSQKYGYSMARLLFPEEYGYDPNAPLYLPTEETVEMDKEKFASLIRQLDSGDLYMAEGNVLGFERKNEEYSFPPILMTEEVCTGFKKENPERKKSITENLWKEQVYPIKNVEATIWGGDIHWDI